MCNIFFRQPVIEDEISEHLGRAHFKDQNYHH